MRSQSVDFREGVVLMRKNFVVFQGLRSFKGGRRGVNAWKTPLSTSLLTVLPLRDRRLRGVYPKPAARGVVLQTWPGDTDFFQFPLGRTGKVIHSALVAAVSRPKLSMKPFPWDRDRLFQITYAVGQPDIQINAERRFRKLPENVHINREWPLDDLLIERLT